MYNCRLFRQGNYGYWSSWYGLWRFDGEASSNNFKNIYVLSREDIILSKIGRYSEIDIEDISIMIGDVDKNLLSGLIDMVITRKNMSDRVKQVFVKNIGLFRERFNV